MLSRLLTTVFLLLFTLAQAGAQGFGVVMDSVWAEPGQTICIPVKAKGFSNILSYQYTMNWDAEVLKYSHVQQFNLSQLSTANFSLSQDSLLTTQWNDIDIEGESKNDGVSVYEVCFIVDGPVGSSTDIRVGSLFIPSVGPAEAYDVNSENVWVPTQTRHGWVKVAATGTIEQELAAQGISLELSPNPTSSVSKATVTLGRYKTGILSITDLMGRIVFEKRLNNTAPQLNIEIPAKALKTKGLYQVYLKTDNKVVTRSLSVL